LTIGGKIPFTGRSPPISPQAGVYDQDFVNQSLISVKTLKICASSRRLNGLARWGSHQILRGFGHDENGFLT